MAPRRGKSSKSGKGGGPSNTTLATIAGGLILAFAAPEVYNFGVEWTNKVDTAKWTQMKKSNRMKACDACKFFVDSSVLSVEMYIYELKGDTPWGDLKLNLNVPHGIARPNGTCGSPHYDRYWRCVHGP